MTFSSLQRPAETPMAVSRAELANHLRLVCGFADVDAASDARLDQPIRAATRLLETRLDTALVSQECTWRQACFYYGRAVALPLSPVSTISSIHIIDADGIITPWSDDAWHLDTVSHPRLRLRKGFGWPQIPEDGYAEVTFTAGYGSTPESLPDDLRQAVLLLAAHFFENTAAASEAMVPLPFGVRHLISPYIAFRL